MYKSFLRNIELVKVNTYYMAFENLKYLNTYKDCTNSVRALGLRSLYKLKKNLNEKWITYDF